eukprot:363979-Chlamydomonas_euryale.AAC.2
MQPRDPPPSPTVTALGECSPDTNSRRCSFQQPVSLERASRRGLFGVANSLDGFATMGCISRHAHGPRHDRVMCGVRKGEGGFARTPIGVGALEPLCGASLPRPKGARSVGSASIRPPATAGRRVPQGNSCNFGQGSRACVRLRGHALFRMAVRNAAPAVLGNALTCHVVAGCDVAAHAASGDTAGGQARGQAWKGLILRGWLRGGLPCGGQRCGSMRAGSCQGSRADVPMHGLLNARGQRRRVLVPPPLLLPLLLLTLLLPTAPPRCAAATSPTTRPEPSPQQAAAARGCSAEALLPLYARIDDDLRHWAAHGISEQLMDKALATQTTASGEKAIGVLFEAGRQSSRLTSLPPPASSLPLLHSSPHPTAAPKNNPSTAGCVEHVAKIMRLLFPQNSTPPTTFPFKPFKPGCQRNPPPPYVGTFPPTAR